MEEDNKVKLDLFAGQEEWAKYYNDKLEQSKFEMKLGGRINGQTIENAFTFLKYLDELKANKMYGIVKCGKAITLLTKQEVISKSRVKEKIQKYNDILNYAETEEGMTELKDYEYEEAKYGKKVLQELLED